MEMLNTKPELVNRRQRLVSQFVKRTRVKKKTPKKLSLPVYCTGSEVDGEIFVTGDQSSMKNVTKLIKLHG